jgi:hypothetical protein
LEIADEMDECVVGSKACTRIDESTAQFFWIKRESLSAETIALVL